MCTVVGHYYKSSNSRKASLFADEELDDWKMGDMGTEGGEEHVELDADIVGEAGETAGDAVGRGGRMRPA